MGSPVVNPDTPSQSAFADTFVRMALCVSTSNMCAAEPELHSKSLGCVRSSQKMLDEEQSLAWEGTITPKNSRTNF